MCAAGYHQIIRQSKDMPPVFAAEFDRALAHIGGRKLSRHRGLVLEYGEPSDSVQIGIVMTSDGTIAVAASPDLLSQVGEEQLLRGGSDDIAVMRALDRARTVMFGLLQFTSRFGDPRTLES